MSPEISPDTQSDQPVNIPAAVRWRDIALVTLITFAIYLPALNNGFVDFDDRGYIVDNPLVQNITWENLKTVWSGSSDNPYYPMVFTTYMVQYALWGDSATGFHATSIILHMLNAMLAYLLVFRLFGSRTPALITGLLVGIHPLHVDAVAWAGALKDVLSATFVFLAMLAYVNYVQKGSRVSYGVSLVLYAFALFSKTMAALLPFLLLIVDYQQRRKNRRLELLEKVPFLLIAVILGGVTLRTQMVLTPLPVGEEMSFYSLPHAFAAIGFYLLKLFAPLNLSVMYASEHPTWWMTVAIILSIAFVTLTVWMLMLSRDYGFGLAWFALLSIPILGFIPFPYVVHVAPYANHFMYLADVGLFVCSGLIARDILKRLETPAERMTLFAVIAVVFSLFSLKTTLRCGVWNNPVTLWQDSVRYNTATNSTVGHYRLGKALYNIGDTESALEHIEIALQRHPGNYLAQRLRMRIEKEAEEE